jgi:hypothetical protein
LAETAKPVVISRIEVLVHPFYTGISRQDKPMPTKQARMKVKILAKQWGKQIKSVAEDPSAILIVMPAYRERRWPITPAHNYYHAQAKRLLLFAKKALGKRLFAFQNFRDLMTFNTALETRGFVLHKKALHGKTFGEYFHACVGDAQGILCNHLGIGLAKIPRAKELSVEGWVDYTTRGPRVKPRKKTRRRPI